MRSRIQLVFPSALVVALALSVGCAQNRNNSGTVEDFNVKLESAKKLLATTPTGTQSLDQLQRFTDNGNVIAVKGINGSTAAGHSGGIHQISSGVYEIHIKQSGNVQDIAQALAHELVHVKNEVLEDKFAAANPDFSARMASVAMLRGQTLEDNYTARKQDVDFYYLSLVFEEIKAYQVNLQLQNEGIPFSNKELATRGLLPYIRATYLPQVLTMTSTDDGATFLNIVNGYDDLVDFQKHWLMSQ